MNMSYCRFENTLSDLQDCYYNMELDDQASEYEKSAHKRLIQLCQKIAEEFGEDNDEDNG